MELSRSTTASRRHGARRPCVRLALAAVLVCAPPGCDSPSASSPPEVARVRVEAAEAGEATVITSTAFVVAAGGVELAEADTQRVTLPFDMDFPLADSRRFFVSVGPPEGELAELRLRVWLDGRSWFDGARELGGDVSTMDFVYRYRDPS